MKFGQLLLTNFQVHTHKSFKLTLLGADSVIIQIDGARGHAVKRTMKHMNLFFKKKHQQKQGPLCKIVLQPAYSPDLNILDLGAWHSLQVAYDKWKRKHIATRAKNSGLMPNTDVIIECVLMKRKEKIILLLKLF